MIVEPVLGAAVGVQWQGVKDLSESDQATGLGVGVMIGSFKRGRLDQPFAVDQSTLRARLGYDPSNLDYMAVQDALDTGAPVVWVKRIVQGSVVACAPTTLSFVPSVVPDGVNNFVMSFQFEYADGMGDVQQTVADVASLDAFGITTAGGLVKYLIFYSGVDLLRQSQADTYFESSPVVGFSTELADGQVVSLTGRDTDFSFDPLNYAGTEEPTTLTLLPTENLLVGQRDWVMEQFGAAVSVHSCLTVVGTGN